MRSKMNAAIIMQAAGDSLDFMSYVVLAKFGGILSFPSFHHLRVLDQNFIFLGVPFDVLIPTHKAVEGMQIT